MIFKKRNKDSKFSTDSGLGAAVAELEAGVAQRDGARTEAAFGAAVRALQTGGAADEFAPYGARLAALLPGFPPTGPRPMLATMAGFCVERGADPATCAEPILAAVRETLTDALEFAARWRAQDPEAELPEPDLEAVESYLARLGGDEYEALRLALAWGALDQWQAPALAVLCRSVAVRQKYATPEFAELVHAVAELEQHDLKCLAYALEVLDDEPLVVLHRPSGTGYELRIGGIGDNFQLHTLLAHALIGGGHLPGEAPAAPLVSMCLDAPFDPRADHRNLHATGPFNLVAPDGSWIWNEGKPSDIPVIDGRRLLVLDPPPYQRSWNGVRFFPMLTASISMTRVLPAEETQAWFQHVSPPRGAGVKG